jgi:deoxyadenosine/deoxycytidine kinase
MLEKARYIVVEGPIGAGKTALAKRLAERLAAETLFENAEQNPFLARFYADPERWGMATELSFFFHRMDQAGLAEPSEHRRIVTDFIPDKNGLFAGLNLSADEYALYKRIVEGMQPASPPRPDLVIYLQAPPETLMERIRQRGSEVERLISESYVESISRRYTDFFYQYEAAPLFVVDAGILNPVDRDEDFELLFERLRTMRSYREFFGYAG